jgi:hypothetical protein
VAALSEVISLAVLGLVLKAIEVVPGQSPHGRLARRKGSDQPRIGSDTETLQRLVTKGLCYQRTPVIIPAKPRLWSVQLIYPN